ncbi:Restriction endonuclease S subunit [Polaribacter sp. KT25b]|uniref:restriction endonuclease subunit S n=1 Tax=Polaribacter sp. KT25b TaxID=1855336 RepID=UPI00087A82BD|nr:restriction endonuclease subunit S [Polaribacter sp. KT25b]SDS19766.1 Restriction endonuclease S subunit [Polaribacter sp. KT25b]
MGNNDNNMTYRQDVQSNKRIQTNTGSRKWKKIGFQKLFTFSTGKNIKQNQASPYFSIPCVRYGELYHMYNEVITDVINYTNLKKEDLIFSEGNEILLPSAGEDPLDIGSASALMVKGVAIGRTINVLKPLKDGVYNQSYVAHYISHILRNNIARLAKGTSISNVYNSDLKQLKISLPPLKEQQKIAEILSQWDEAIETTQTLIDQLQLRKKGLMQALLSGKKRLTGFSEEWKEDKLGSYFTERKETGLDNLQLLSVGKEGVYPQDDSNKKDTSNSNKSKYKRICKGDIGYNTMRMWQGRSALSQLEGIVSPVYTILKPKENCDSVFFSHLFKLDDMIHKFYRNSQGMVSDTWMCKFKDLKIVKFNAPSSLEEQKAISKIIGLADVEIEEKKTYLLKLKEQKKGLMQQLLTGKKRVKLN